MKYLKRYLLIAVGAWLICAEIACLAKEAGPNDGGCPTPAVIPALTDEIGHIDINSSVFPNTKLITFSAYSYVKNGKTFAVNMQKSLSKNDLCSFLDSVTLQSSTPRFILPVSNAKLVAVCVSKSILKVRTDNKSIDNIEDILWTWNSGLKTGSISGGRLDVDYPDGRMVFNGKVDSASAVTPLETGQLYYLSMWAWNDQGTDIESSSANIPFMVESRYYSFPSLRFIVSHLPTINSNGSVLPALTWKITSINDVTTGQQLSNPNVPQVLDITYLACTSTTKEAYFLTEGEYLKNITYDGRNLFVATSQVFKSKLQLLYLCPGKLVFRTMVGDKDVIITYTKS